MGANSKIEWTDHTFNPWWGCTRVSPGCDHCYAEHSADLIQIGKREAGRLLDGREWNEAPEAA